MTSNERRKLAAQKHNAELDARRKRQEEREQQLAKIREASEHDGTRRVAVIGHHSRSAIAYTAIAAMLACQVEEPPKFSAGSFHQAQQRIRRCKK